MRVGRVIRRLRRPELLVLVGAALAACATGLEPDRSALEGGTGGATSASSASGVLVGSSTVAVGSTATVVGSSGADSSSSADSSSADSSSANSSGAASGAGGGAIEDAGADAPPPTGLRLQYKVFDTAPMNEQIKADFNVINDSPMGVAMNDLAIRYWYTIDGGAQTEQFFCDYAMVGNANVKGAFGQAAGVNADHYLEVTFTSASVIQAGGQSGEVQARWNKTDFSNYNENNDYSYDLTKTQFADWTKVTLYHKGTLVWGVEP